MRYFTLMITGHHNPCFWSWHLTFSASMSTTILHLDPLKLCYWWHLFCTSPVRARGGGGKVENVSSVDWNIVNCDVKQQIHLTSYVDRLSWALSIATITSLYFELDHDFKLHGQMHFACHHCNRENKVNFVNLEDLTKYKNCEFITPSVLASTCLVLFWRNFQYSSKFQFANDNWCGFNTRNAY